MYNESTKFNGNINTQRIILPLAGLLYCPDCGGKIKYGFTGLYVYAGSENTFFDKVSYLIITWAPFIVWGVVFLLLNLLLPEAWFWVAYLWQVCNVSSAVGAFYISFRVIKMPRDVFVRDTGLGITLYTKN